jgi:hypothetical protein
LSHGILFYFLEWPNTETSSGRGVHMLSVAICMVHMHESLFCLFRWQVKRSVICLFQLQFAWSIFMITVLSISFVDPAWWAISDAVSPLRFKSCYFHLTVSNECQVERTI